MPPTSFRILVGTDFSESASLALDHALEGARRTERPELHFVSVIDDGAHHLIAGDRHATLTQAVDRVRELLSAEVSARSHAIDRAMRRRSRSIRSCMSGSAESRSRIAALATEIRADLVIVGTHGRRGVRRLIMGSVAERTIRLAPCPVLVVRPKDFHAMDGLPAINPPCPACVKERERSAGAHWWCAAHEGQRESAHTYSFSGQLTDPHTPLNHLL